MQARSFSLASVLLAREQLYVTLQKSKRTRDAVAHRSPVSSASRVALPKLSTVHVRVRHCTPLLCPQTVASLSPRRGGNVFAVLCVINLMIVYVNAVRVFSSSRAVDAEVGVFLVRQTGS